MKILLTTLLTAMLVACQYNPHARNATTHEPTAAEIVGEYELDRIYMESYSEGIGAKVASLPIPPMIRIYTDGTLVAEQFPYFTEMSGGFDYRFEDFRALRGRWEQVAVATIANGSGRSKTHYGFLVEGEDFPAHLARFGFTGEPKVDGLILGFGDPDSGDAIIYKKIKPNKSEQATPRKPSD